MGGAAARRAPEGGGRAPTSPGIVKVKLVMLKGPTKFARKERTRSPAQKQAEEDAKVLKMLVYGETPVDHADSCWTAEASDFLHLRWSHTAIVRPCTV